MFKRCFTAILLLALSVMFTGCANTPDEPVMEQTAIEETVPDTIEEQTDAPDNNDDNNTEETVIPDEEILEEEVVEDSIPTEYFESVSDLDYYFNQSYFNETLQYPSSNKDFEYNVYETYIQITKYIGESNTVVFPSKIDELPVRIIGSDDEARVIDREKNPVTSIVIEPGIQIIKNGALSCQGYMNEAGEILDLSGVLKSVSLPEGLLYIGSYAFYDCGGLTELKLPDSLLAIGDDAFFKAFADNSKASVIIPESVKIIGVGSFTSDSNSLSDITILNDSIKIDHSGVSSYGYVITSKEDGQEITIHGHAGSTAAQLAADTKQKFEIIN